MRPLPKIVAMMLVCACATPPTPPAPVVEPASEPAPPPPASEPTTTTAAPAPTPPTPAVFERPADWPADVVFPLAFDPDDVQLTVGPAGDLRLEHYVPRNDLAGIGKTWTDAFAARGFVPREPCVEAPTFSCVYTGNDRLAEIAAWSSAETESTSITVHVLPAKHVPITKLPGPCVTPPVRRRDITVNRSGFDQQGQFIQDSLGLNAETHAGPDLDGDTRLEIYVPHATKGECPWDVPHDVYIMRGTCGHKVGTVIGHLDAETFTAKFHRGLRVVHTTAEWSTRGTRFPEPEHHTRTREYKFDGKRLVQTRSDERAGICHHCGVADCVERK